MNPFIFSQSLGFVQTRMRQYDQKPLEGASGLVSNVEILRLNP
jgi:hypothetical protein